jgi:hypothetical protein
MTGAAADPDQIMTRIEQLLEVLDPAPRAPCDVPGCTDLHAVAHHPCVAFPRAA